MHKGQIGSADRRRLDRTRRRLEPLLRRVLHGYWRFARALTLGVRAVVLDREGRVFLVQHSYTSGWHLPGGGVEVGETIGEALRRELVEEGNIECIAAPELFGVYFNRSVSQRDHIALFIVRDFRQDVAPAPNHEIVAHGFFAPDALPPDTSAGTRARLAEVLDKMPASEWW